MGRRAKKKAPKGLAGHPDVPDVPDVESDWRVVTVDPRFVAARRLLEIARRKVTPEDVRRYVPNDPGVWGYVSAFDAILRDGEAAISRDFDVVETINLTRWRPASRRDVAFRWFRVLTSAVDILIDDSERLNYRLVTLLVDTFALAEAGERDAPTDLLPAICREIDAQTRREPQLVFCKLAELIVASVVPVGDAEIEALCAEIEAEDRRAKEWYVDGFEQNPYYVSCDEFFWACTSFDTLHPDWLRLVATRLPVEPPAAAALRERLLRDGAPWSKSPRKLEREEG